MPYLTGTPPHQQMQTARTLSPDEQKNLPTRIVQAGWRDEWGRHPEPKNHTCIGRLVHGHDHYGPVFYGCTIWRDTSTGVHKIAMAPGGALKPLQGKLPPIVATENCAIK